MRIALITDLHVRSLRGVSPLAFFGKRVLGGLNLVLRRAHQVPRHIFGCLMADLNEAKPDHILVGGDLGNLSFVGEFELARKYLATLALPPTEITVIPGNHDYYTPAAVRAGDFARVFAPFLTADLRADEQQIYPFVRLRGEVAIIALSTACPCGPTEAIGTLGPGQLQRAEKLLMHPEVRQRFRLVLLHHPPRVSQKNWHKRLTDGDEFCQLIARTGADLVLHGHLHRQLSDEIAGNNGVTPVIGVNSATWLSKDPARIASYSIYTIADGQLRATEIRRYDRATRSFLSPPC